MNSHSLCSKGLLGRFNLSRESFGESLGEDVENDLASESNESDTLRREQLPKAKRKRKPRPQGKAFTSLVFFSSYFIYFLLCFMFMFITFITFTYLLLLLRPFEVLLSLFLVGTKS